MSEWIEGSFEIRSHDGSRSVTGVVSDPFGIHFDEQRTHPGWVVTHIGTGMSIGGWHPFKSVDTAKKLVARIRPLADWDNVDPDDPPEVSADISQIVDELAFGKALTAVEDIPPYIGDDAFRKFLQDHECRTSFEEIRMRLLGAMVSPGREGDIYPFIEDFFENGMPEFDDGEGLVAFLHTFLGLWNGVDEASRFGPIKLPPVGAITSHEEIKNLLYSRIDAVAFSFLDGVWGDDDELPLTLANAATLTAIEEAGRNYDVLLVELVRKDGTAIDRPVADLLREITEIDETVETAITSVVEALRNDPSAEHPMMKRAKAIIDEFAVGEGLPREDIRQCIARRDEMVPVFLNILREYAEGRAPIDDRESALFLIIHILGELGEQQAFAPLMDLLDGNFDRVEAALGDAVTENLTQILISVFDGDTDRLYRVMKNPDVNEFIRAAVFETWVHSVATGCIDRVEAEQFLSSCFETLKPQTDHYVWVAWVEAVAHLGFAELTETVRKAFDLGRVPPMTILFSEFEEIVKEATEADDPVAFVGKERMKPFTDTIGVLSQWHCFSEEYLREQTDTEQAERQPFQPTLVTDTITNPYSNVGRNDPCPCGSGKKFKKCCLH